MDDIKIGSNKSFGIVFFVVFLLISLYPLLNNEDIRIWSLVISFIFLILGMIGHFVHVSLAIECTPELLHSYLVSDTVLA